MGLADAARAAIPPVSTPIATLLVVGDSLSAGYGLETGKGWVDLLRQRL
ncbi:MAG: arylesterase, partial [Betaproteobacteria bacterium]|nr:arylesterase [Betaproteobacteria bacterium]